MSLYEIVHIYPLCKALTVNIKQNNLFFTKIDMRFSAT